MEPPSGAGAAHAERTADAALPRPPTVAAEVHARIRARLLHGDWPPGARLRESELAERYGVSRTPVREAVRRLLQEGLLEARPPRGVRVRRPDRAAALDAYDVRATLEGMAARLAAERASDARRRALQELLEHVEASAAAGPAAQVDADLAFHRRVAELSGNEALIRALDGLEGQIVPLKVHTRDQNASRVTRDQHRAIAHAIGAGDADEAERAMRDHVGWFRALLADRFAEDGP